jgi:hypothetical protein
MYQLFFHCFEEASDRRRVAGCGIASVTARRIALARRRGDGHRVARRRGAAAAERHTHVTERRSDPIKTRSWLLDAKAARRVRQGALGCADETCLLYRLSPASDFTEDKRAPRRRGRVRSARRSPSRPAPRGTGQSRPTDDRIRDAR